MNDEDQKRFACGSGLPFSTTDAVLANCLRIAGIKEAPWSPRNFYDENILFTAGGGLRTKDGSVTRRSRFAGLSVLEAAKKAWAEKTKGRVEYHFEHSPEIETFCKAYADQAKRIQESDGDAGEAIREIMRRAAGRTSPEEAARGSTVEIMDEREALLRILCVALKLRIEYVNRWKEVTPTLHVRNAGAVQSVSMPSGRRREVYPGGKFVSLDASEETMQKLKLV
jgi:hypothetical protein